VQVLEILAFSAAAAMAAVAVPKAG